MPTADLTELNAGIGNLDNKLVPIVASDVRLCRYAGSVVHDVSEGFHDAARQLVGSALLKRLAAKQFEDDANALPKGGPSGCPCCPVLGSSVQMFFLTFFNDTQAVYVEEEYPGCNPGPSNGRFLAQLDSAMWHNELVLRTSR